MPAAMTSFKWGVVYPSLRPAEQQVGARRCQRAVQLMCHGLTEPDVPHVDRPAERRLPHRNSPGVQLAIEYGPPRSSARR